MADFKSPASFAKMDEGFVEALWNQMGPIGGIRVLDDTKVPPKPVKPATVEELFVTPMEYETGGKWNLQGFYNPRYRGKTYTDRMGNHPRLTREHETEHALTDMAPPQLGSRWKEKNELFRENSAKAAGTNWGMKNENWTNPAEFMGALANRIEQIKKRFPEMKDSRYLTPEFLRRVASRDAAGFNEVLAELATMERAYGVDLLKEEAFKDVWKLPGSYAAYRSMTGLRNTITDPKDIPPMTIDDGTKWYRK